MYVFELAGDDDRFAASEAGAAGAGVRVVAPGLAVADAVDLDRVRGLAFTRYVSRLVARCKASVASAVAALEAVDLPNPGGTTVAVRARDVRSSAGADTRAAEHALGDVLVKRGYAVDLEDPDRVLRACFSGDVCLLGWLGTASARGYGDRQPTDRPFFQPGSMDPLLARALVNLALADVDPPDATLLDPMCGTGGLLLEARLLGADAVGVDAQWKMVRGTRENLSSVDRPEGPTPDAATGLGDFAVARGDATRLPVRDDAADAVAVDAPYGRQSKVVGDLTALVAGALREARRVAPRAVLVADRECRGAAEAAGWAVVGAFERRVHRSLTRRVLVLDRD